MFDSEVVEYVDFIFDNGRKLRMLNMKLEANEISQERLRLEEWFDSEVNTKNVYKKFEKYMRIYYPDQSVLSKMKQRAALIFKKIEEANRNVSGSE